VYPIPDTKILNKNKKRTASMASTDISLFAYEHADEKKEKSPTALRTISEASEILDVPQHVLRFWETKFSQIKPLKRNGGRRFYRPQDIEVLQQIKHLLYNQGYTIKGAKKAVDDFIHARAERSVSGSEWMANVPPASVNDNFAAPAPSVAELSEPGTDVLADIAQALKQPVVNTSEPAHEALASMRAELASLRDSLRLLLPAASPLPQ
jgi:DNA-binding transcriptional MerR regulator